MKSINMISSIISRFGIALILSVVVPMLVLYSNDAIGQPQFDRLAASGNQRSSSQPLSYFLPVAGSATHPNLRYNPAVPTPEAFFGFQIGQWHLRPDQVLDYVRALAAAAPQRIVLQEYGKSYEQRPLVLAIISSPATISNLSAVKRAHLQLGEPTSSLTAQQLESMPVVTWLGYTVHGNEPSGLNAVPLVAYFLAAAEGDAQSEITAWLNNAVIILDLCLNPDGAARFAHWANTNRGMNAVADPQTREHNEGWLSGRFNHYWFDPNRDWMPLAHPEARARVQQFHEWKPNVITDHHEMGRDAVFFFQPAAPSRNNPHSPEQVFDFTRKLAAYHARALDSIGTIYFTKEYFDDFYIGKGSTYPDINGSVGILFEQGSSRGHLQESSNGLLTFASTIRNQVLASFSTLRGSVALRKELLAFRREFAKQSLQEAEKSPVKGYVLGSNDAARMYHFLDLIKRHQIEAYELSKTTTIEGKRFEAGKAFVIPAAQPQYRLLTGMFEKRTTFQDSVFYDISAWTVPLAFGLNFAELKGKSAAEIRDLQGKRVEALSFPSKALPPLMNDSTTMLYAVDWRDYYAPRALMRLLKAGILAKVATKPFEAKTSDGKQSFGYGTIVIPVGLQPDRAAEIRSLLRTIATEDGVTVRALTTGLAESGIDAGSRNMVSIEKPHVLVVVGEGVTPPDAGEVWHLLDTRFGFEVSIIEQSQIERADLNRYNTIILPNGSYTRLNAERFKRWVESGGVLIGIEEATSWLVAQEFIKAEPKKTPTAAKDKEPEPSRRDYALLEQDAGAQNMDGAIFEVRIDPTHPICYGYEDRTMAVFRSNKVFLEPSKNPYATPLAYTVNPLLAGYISASNLAQLKNAGDVFTSALRGGRVIAFTSNPNFRAFWYGTNKLFLNAIFFGRIISDRAALWGGRITNEANQNDTNDND